MEDINNRRQFIYQSIYDTILNNERKKILDIDQNVGNLIDKLTPQHLTMIFNLYDSLFLNLTLSKYLEEGEREKEKGRECINNKSSINNNKIPKKNTNATTNNNNNKKTINPRREISLNLVFSKGTRTAGTCKTEWTNTYVKHTISISKPILRNLFKEEGAVETVNGLQCHDQLSCLLSVFEHELIHLLIQSNTIQDQDNSSNKKVASNLKSIPVKTNPIKNNSKKEKDKKHHGPLFQQLAYDIFGHKDYRHFLGQGLDEDPRERIKKIQQYLINGKKRSEPKPFIITIDQTKYIVDKINTRTNAKTFIGINNVTKISYRISLLKVPLPRT